MVNLIMKSLDFVPLVDPQADRIANCSLGTCAISAFRMVGHRRALPHMAHTKDRGLGAHRDFIIRGSSIAIQFR